jgi:rhodanese-related sulfurtransferase
MKFLIAFIFSLVSLFAVEKNYAGDICLQTKPTIPSDAILIDVRTVQEYDFQHAKGAVNIPVQNEVNGRRVLNPNFMSEVVKLTNDDIDKHIVIICRSGKRSILASNMLAEYGYENVYNVEKGFIHGYKKTNLPVER